MERIRKIIPADKEAYAAAKSCWDSIAKPLGSFGLLEEAVERIAAVQRTDKPDISKRTAPPTWITLSCLSGWGR